jgi:hypothetical protein
LDLSELGNKNKILEKSLEYFYQFPHLKNQNKIHNIFFSYENRAGMVLTMETLNEILEYLDKSIKNLAKESVDNLEIDGGLVGILSFLENQFDVRLENMLVAKKSSIHHLESGMKNKVIQRKQTVIDSIRKQYEN